MKIIVTGAQGQLGYDVVKELNSREEHTVFGIDINDLNITNSNDVLNFFDKYKPDVIIHCAAYTEVDKAEDNEEICINVNINGTKFLVEAAKSINAKFVYISTDYVFDGDKNGFYDIDDFPNPKSIYGKTKLLGEIETQKYDKHFIVRTSWVFGKNGNNFVKTMLKLGRERTSLDVVNDQTGSPTYTQDLAKLIGDMIESDKYGIYQATNEGRCSWYEFAKEIFKLANINITVNSIKTEQYHTKAKRPRNSLMSKKSLDNNGFRRLPNWKNALYRYLKEMQVI